MNKKKLATFTKTIWDFYNQHGRSFAWRTTTNPYHIVVSEIMLQQTQTHRVENKYQQFIAAFPTFESLAHAPLRSVLTCWQGLGYNRRALALQKTALRVVNEFDGVLPCDPELLVSFPGIGPATSNSICAFAFNMRTVFIETNIRAVFIHFFFKNSVNVPDKLLMPLIAQTVDTDRPRQWYYALMDYGVMLKKTIPNPSKKSAHHTTQSKFEGSDRQIRGMILKALTNLGALTLKQLIETTQREPHRISKIIVQLKKEEFIVEQDNMLSIR